MDKLIRYLVLINLALIIVLCASGVLLSVYYTPTPDDAYSSIVKISTDVPFGAFVRSVHHYTTPLLIVAVTALLACSAWQYTLIGKRWYAMVGMAGMGLLAAWTGRLLPQDVYAQTSQLVVGFGITEAPFGSVMSTLLGVSAQNTVFLTQILTLHTFVCGSLLIACAIWLRRQTDSKTTYWWQLPMFCSMALFGTGFLRAPLSEQAGLGQNGVWAGGPWWMFRFLHNWNDWFGAELTSYFLVAFLALFIWLPFSNAAIDIKTRRAGILTLLLLLAASSL